MNHPNNEELSPIMPSPVPTSLAIGTVQMPDGSHAVFFQALTPTGSHVVFLPPDHAEIAGKQLLSMARDARVKLTVANVMPMGPSSPLNGHDMHKE